MGLKIAGTMPRNQHHSLGLPTREAKSEFCLLLDSNPGQLHEFWVAFPSATLEQCHFKVGGGRDNKGRCGDLNLVLLKAKSDIDRWYYAKKICSLVFR